MFESQARGEAGSDTDLLEHMSDAYLLGRLVPGFVHATGNDLQVVLGAADSLGVELLSPKGGRRLAMIVDASNEAARRTTDLRDLTMALSAESRVATSVGTLAETVVASTARIVRLSSNRLTVRLDIEPHLGELPAPSPSELRTVERLIVCLVLHALAIAPAPATPRLRIGVERHIETAALHIVLGALCPRAGTAPTTPAITDGTDFALLSVLVDRAGAELAQTPGQGSEASFQLTLPLHSVDAR